MNPEREGRSPVPHDTSPSGSPLAFFDLDGTLVAGQTQRMLVSFLRSRGLASRRFVVGTVLWFVGYKAGVLEATDEARARGATLFRGLDVAEVARVMDRFRDECLAPRLYPPAVSALAEHRRRGHRVMILSAAFEPLVATLARRLGVEDYAATALEISRGAYTGAVAGRPLYGGEKASAALSAMRDARVDPESCWAYADHETDMSLLELVGRPVAVRPDAALRKAARGSGWPVIE